MAIRLTSCSSSLEEEDWKDRLEEDEESMVAEKVFCLPIATEEQEDEEANRSTRLKIKGIQWKFNVTAVSEEVVPKNLTARSRGEVEKARHHDDGYCDGSATT
jgi:hypothetical protein